MYWIEFFISALLIVFSGVRLTTYADKLGDKFHIGKTWIGVILLGLVTSLPEAITSLTAVVSLKADDLALGNLLGSNNFNILLVVLIDFYYRKGHVSNIIEIKKSQKFSAGFSLALISVVFFQMVFQTYIPEFQGSPVSFSGILLIVIYLYGMRHIALQGQKEGAPECGHITQDRIYLKGDNAGTALFLNIFFSAVLVIVGAMWLAKSADMISIKTGLGRTFVGSIFLAMATSLPEMVVTISALKLGSFDLAIGNIFGSNMTNMFIVSLCDMARNGGSIFNDVSGTHAYTAVLGIILSFVAIIGLMRKYTRSYFGLGWDSWSIVSIFVVGNFLIYKGIFIH